MIFLVMYSRKDGLESVTAFQDADIANANAMREKAIRENLTRIGDMEIALFESVDEAMLRKTHRRYFESIQQMGDSLTKKPA